MIVIKDFPFVNKSTNSKWDAMNQTLTVYVLTSSIMNDLNELL